MRQTLISIAAFGLLASQTLPAAADDAPAPDTSAPPAPAPSAAADPAKAECFARHEDAQVARRQGHLLEARAWLRQCASATCIGIVRADCIEWLAEVERAIPSVVITARARGADLVDVKVIIDKQPVTARLTGTALDLDPGEHQLRFESPPWPAVERTILVSEGVKDRPIDVEFAPVPAPTTPTAPSLPAPFFKPPGRFDYVMAGIAAAGLATSLTFGTWALWSRSNLDSCAPFGADEDTNPVRAKLIVADVALGVTIVSLAIVFLHLRAPAHTSATRTGTPLVFASPTGGASVGWGGVF
jgi:hypothetical protein